MLYPQSAAPRLPVGDFQNPPAQYRGCPFWAWNCRVTGKLITEQAAMFQRMGMGGAMIHPRTGMATPYLGPEYFGFIRLANRELKARGMYCWLYDEERFPSGAAGGLVTRDLRFRSRHLLLTQNARDGFCPSRAVFEAEVRKGGKPAGYFAAAYRVRLENGRLKEYARIPGAVGDGKVWYTYVRLMEESPWFNGQAYVDVFNREAVQRFIQVTHERYFEALGSDFGGSVPAIFTDEPHMKGKSSLDFAESGRDVTLAYTDDMDDTYRAACGVSLLDILPELLWELPEGRVSVHRYRYHDHVSERFAAAFGDTVGEWCRAHGISFTGHYLSERTLYSQTLALGDAMRQYRSQQIPGIDILADQKELSTAKQAASVARQYGREGVASEMYGVTHWDFDFKGHKLQGDWQAALGVTVRIHHLAFMSMAGEAKRDWPASIAYQSPWFEEYPYIEDHFARLNTALTRGEPVVRVGVVHPIESFWLAYGPNDQTQAARDQMDEDFEALMQWLLYGTIDFDLISEALLPGLCGAGASPLPVGRMRYDAVVLPRLSTIRSTTLDRLEAFVRDGGRLIFAGRVPALEDGVPSGRAALLARHSILTGYSRAELLACLEAERIVEIRDARTGRLSGNLVHQLRRDGENRFLFVCHVHRKRNLLDRAEEYRIRVKGLWQPTLYDTMTGQTAPLPAGRRDGDTLVEWHAFAEDSLLLLLEPFKGKAGGGACPPAPAEPEPFMAIDIAFPDAFFLSEPNALLLDACQYSLDGGPFHQAEHILRADNSIRRTLGFPERKNDFVQPWLLPDDLPAHEVRLRFIFQSGIAAENAVLAMERPENALVTLNGRPAGTPDGGWYVDQAIGTLPLPPVLPGENLLEITVPFTIRTDLESVYILGAFGVDAAGNRARVTRLPDGLAFDDITRQGLPFYTGNVVYQASFRLPADCREVTLEVPHFASPVLAVSLDGSRRGVIALAPHRLSLGSLPAGAHMLSICAYGNRFNGFGTLHNCNDEYKWYGPDSFRTTGSEWSDTFQLRRFGVLSPVRLLCRGSRGPEAPEMPPAEGI